MPERRTAMLALGAAVALALLVGVALFVARGTAAPSPATAPRAADDGGVAADDAGGVSIRLELPGELRVGEKLEVRIVVEAGTRVVMAYEVTLLLDTDLVMPGDVTGAGYSVNRPQMGSRVSGGYPFTLGGSAPVLPSPFAISAAKAAELSGDVHVVTLELMLKKMPEDGHLVLLPAPGHKSSVTFRGDGTAVATVLTASAPVVE